ncbi:hypothetical protein AB0M29_41215 [Streptomyces sp. NPDC051976]|uniref:hypothetical protein n=1 Tax=Streptomyces sp. NPDC051976 TaxID=3154947 RepID=UPI003414434C
MTAPQPEPNSTGRSWPDDSPYAAAADGPSAARRRRGNAVRVATFVTGVGIAALLAVHVVESHDSGHRLSVPRTLDHGRYTLAQDAGGQESGGLDRNGDAPGMHDMTGVGGSYKAAPPRTSAHDLLDFDGDYGTVTDRSRAISGMLTWMGDSGEGDVAVPPRSITPAGASAPLTCEITSTIAVGDQRTYRPLCAWADSHTVGAVAETDYDHLATSAHAVDLAAFAARVNTIRDEVGG